MNANVIECNFCVCLTSPLLIEAIRPCDKRFAHGATKMMSPSITVQEYYSIYGILFTLCLISRQRSEDSRKHLDL
jgi:hypothetical protein